MKQLRLPAMAAAALVLVGCVGTTPPIYTETPPSKDVEVIVCHFRKAYPSHHYPGTSDFGRIVAEYVAAQFQNNGISAIAAPAVPEDAQAEYIIKGALTECNEGVWSLRFWIGFGAGVATMKARSRLLSFGGREELNTFDDGRGSTSWQQTEPILRSLGAELSRDIYRQFAPHVR